MTAKQDLDNKTMDAILHQNEIERTRVGGFGGSDAKMFYKIGLKGLSALSNSDKKRIRVAKGIDEYKPIFQTEAMLVIAWKNIQEKKGNNSSTFDWDKGEYGRGVEDSEGREKN